MDACPDFECLAPSAEHCDSHYGCSGCQTRYSCDHCAKREIVVNGSIVPCLNQNNRSAIGAIPAGFATRKILDQL